MVKTTRYRIKKTGYLFYKDGKEGGARNVSEWRKE